MNVLTSFNKSSEEVEATRRVDSTPLLLHFHAPACHASQELSSVLAELAEPYKGELEFRQINVEESLASQLLVEYEILSLPTLLLLDRGVPLIRIRGFISKHALAGKINQFLKERDRGGRSYPLARFPSSLFSWRDPCKQKGCPSKPVLRSC